MPTTAAPRTITVERRTTLGAPVLTVWQRATTPAGINAELEPWVRMTMPRRLRAMTLDEVELGVRVCRSWVILFGVVPFEYDDLVVVDRGPGLRFLERSSTLTARTWQHQRTVVPRGPGCEARRPRRRRASARGGACARRRGRVPDVVRAIFAHRHRRLTAMYEARPTPATPT